MELPKRKANRLENYDYAGSGVYFITICTKERKCTLSRISVGTSIARPPTSELTATGDCVKKAIEAIPQHYPAVFVDRYVIMPNHVHLLLRIEKSGRAMPVPTISRVVQQMKGSATKQAGFPIWQTRFYDHIIRDEDDYLTRAKYVDDNPVKWAEDKSYTDP